MQSNKKLYSKVKEILEEWDPIGIATVGDAADEYASYINGIISLLKSGADETKIVRHLENLEKVSMGLSKKSPRLDKVARKLLELSDR